MYVLSEFLYGAGKGKSRRKPSKGELNGDARLIHSVGYGKQNQGRGASLGGRCYLSVLYKSVSD